MTEYKRNWTYIIIGILIMLSSLALFIAKHFYVTFVVEISAVVIGIYGIVQFFRAVVDFKSESFIKNIFLYLAIGLFCLFMSGWLLRNTSIPIRMLSYIIGSYQIIIGLVNLISYYLLKKDQVTDRFSRVIYAVVHIIMGVSTITLSLNHPQVLNLLSAYIFFIGLTYIGDGRKIFYTDEESHKMKRKMRIPVPVVFHALLPQKMIRKVNEFIEDELDIDDDIVEDHQRHLPSKIDERHILQVQVSTSPNDIDRIGHTNICYQGMVYSYGNHDVDSRHLFGSIGDGVVAVCDKESYLDFVVKRGTTITEYDIVLTDKQVDELEKQLDEIKANVYPWEPTSKVQLESYGGTLVRETNTQLYKFSKSRFKTYFVFGTNCVLLTDQIIGISGLDLFIMVGVMTPGTYYDYFEKEYNKPGSIIINRRIYNQDLFKHLNLPKLNTIGRNNA